MSEPFTMPILRDYSLPPTAPRESFTWTPSVEDRRWSEHNHGQTLERIRERGGFAWCELAAVLCHREWHKMDKAAAIAACESAANPTPNTGETDG